MSFISRIFRIPVCIAFCFLIIPHARGQLQEQWRVTLSNSYIFSYAMTASGSTVFTEIYRNTNLTSISALDAAGLGHWKIVSAEIGFRSVLSDGGECVYACGTSNASGGFVLLKIDSAGNQLWKVADRSLNGDALIARDSKGDIVAAGTQGTWADGSYWLAKYNSNGIALWRTNLPAKVYAVRQLSLDDSGGIIVHVTGEPERLQKFSPDAVLMWSQEKQDYTHIEKLTVSGDGALFILTAYGGGLAKLNSSGEFIWQRPNVRSVVRLEEDGDVLVNEEIPPDPTFNRGIATLTRLDRNGDPRWQTPFPGDPIRAWPAGDHYVTAGVKAGYWPEPFYLAELTAFGRQLWLQSYTNALQTQSDNVQDFVQVSDGTFRLIAAIPPVPPTAAVIASFVPKRLAGLPEIILDPESTNVVVTQTARFTVSATGQEPLAYQWFKNNQALTGETSSSFQFSTNNEDVSYIFVEVTNAVGRVRSGLARLRVLYQPDNSFEALSPFFSVGLNAPMELAASNSGSLPFWYQWYHNNSPLESETNRVLRIEGTDSSHDGEYRVRIANPVGQTSQLRHLIVNTSVSEEWRHMEAPRCCHSLPSYQLPAADGGFFVASGQQLRKFSAAGEIVWTINNSILRMIPDDSGGVITSTYHLLTRYSPDGEVLWHGIDYNPLIPSSTNIVLFDRSELQIYDYNHTLLATIPVPCSNCFWERMEKALGPAGNWMLLSGIIQEPDSTLKRVVTWVNTDGTAGPFLELGLSKETEIDLAQSPTGSVVSTLGAVDPQSGSRQLTTVAFNHAGLEQWRAATLASGARNTDNLTASKVRIALDGFGDVVVAADFNLVKYDSAGVQLWRSHSGHPDFGTTRPQELRVSANGDIYLLAGNAKSHLIVEKLSSDGGSVWVTTLAAAYQNAPAGFDIDGSGNIFVSTGAGTVNSSIVAKLTQTNDPAIPRVIKGPPDRLFAAVAGSTTVTIVADGEAPLEFQWFRDSLSTPIVNATNGTLILSNVSYGDHGHYFLQARNAHGSVITRPFEILVGEPPSFKLWDGGMPISSSFARVNEGGSVSIMTQEPAVPADPLASPTGWEWQFNGASIPNGNREYLRLTNVSLAQAGTYTLTASNAYGTASRSITLIVDPHVRTLLTTTRPAPSAVTWPFRYDPPAPRLAANKASELYLLGSESNSVRWFLSKYKPDGRRLWTARFGPMAIPASLTLDARENVVVAGTAVLGRKGVVALVKYNPTGKALWERSSASANGASRFTTAMVRTSNDDLYVAGVEHSASPRNFVAKFTSSGTLAWTRYILIQPSEYYGGPGLAAAPDGGVYVGSLSGLVRFSAAGQKLWRRDGEVFDVTVGPAGHVYVTGATGTAKYTPSGRRLWDLSGRGYHIRLDRSGLLLGSEDQIQRLTHDGKTMWKRSFIANALTLDRQGNAYACASAPNLPLAAFNAEGQDLWQATSPSISYARSSDMAVCQNGDIAVAHLLDSQYYLVRYRPRGVTEAVPVSISLDTIGPAVPGSTICFTGQTVAETESIAWFRNGVQLPLQTNKTFCLTADWDTDGAYSMGVFSGGRFVTSPEVNLELARPYFYPPKALENGDIMLRLLPRARWGAIAIETSTDLRNWRTLTNISAGPLPTIFTVPGDVAPRFFRAIAE